MDPKHGLTRGRVFEVLKEQHHRPYIVTDLGDEVWLKLKEFKWIQ